VGVTDIQVKWNAPGVKGREGKIWGTDIANYGSQVLGFDSNLDGWGSYFFQKDLDVLRVTTIQQKNQPNLQERLFVLVRR
jgi:hypothetical protein